MPRPTRFHCRCIVVIIDDPNTRHAAIDLTDRHVLLIWNGGVWIQYFRVDKDRRYKEGQDK
jgi:hypothetical protein